MRRFLEIWSAPDVSGGEPLTGAVRVIDLLDRLDAGDSTKAVAEDFGISTSTDSLELLQDLAKAIRTGLLEQLAEEFEKRADEQDDHANEWVETRMAGLTYRTAASTCRRRAEQC